MVERVNMGWAFAVEERMLADTSETFAAPLRFPTTIAEGDRAQAEGDAFEVVAGRVA